MAGLLPLAEGLGRFALHRRGMTSRRVATRVGQVHAYDGPGRGSFAPMVVVHGLGSAATPFAPLLTRLLPHASRVTAPELPGHGFSDAPSTSMTPVGLTDAMGDALDALIDAPALLCGNSLGGAVALRYALERPEKVRGLVLISPAASLATDADLDALRDTFALPTARDTVAFMRKIYHRPPWFAPLVAGEVRARMHRPVVRELLTSARPDHAATPAELASLRVPVLLLWGRSERLLPASALAYLRAHLPSHAVIEEPDDVGHCPHFDDAPWLAQRITRFAATV